MTFRYFKTELEAERWPTFDHDVRAPSPYISNGCCRVIFMVASDKIISMAHGLVPESIKTVGKAWKV